MTTKEAYQNPDSVILCRIPIFLILASLLIGACIADVASFNPSYWGHFTMGSSNSDWSVLHNTA
ncbi:MAG: hypothetical protein WAV05_08770, partial [Anaerolineales bacterium]